MDEPVYSIEQIPRMLPTDPIVFTLREYLDNNLERVCEVGAVATSGTQAGYAVTKTVGQIVDAEFLWTGSMPLGDTRAPFRQISPRLLRMLAAVYLQMADLVEDHAPEPQESDGAGRFHDPDIRLRDYFKVEPNAAGEIRFKHEPALRDVLDGSALEPKQAKTL